MLSRRKRRTEFEQTALPYLDSLYGAAYRMTRNARDAEDLVQETMLRAYRFWDTFETSSNCKAWLFRILTNTFINGYQKRKRAREVLNQAVSEHEATGNVLVQESSLSQKDPEGLLLDSTLSDEVARALKALPEDFRIAVVLCDVEGFSYKEIADIVDCPVGTVMSRLHRGRKLLKQSLQEFAIAQGIIRRPAETRGKDDTSGLADTIDLAHYRKRQR